MSIHLIYLQPSRILLIRAQVWLTCFSELDALWREVRKSSRWFVSNSSFPFSCGSASPDCICYAFRSNFAASCKVASRSVYPGTRLFTPFASLYWTYHFFDSSLYLVPHSVTGNITTRPPRLLRRNFSPFRETISGFWGSFRVTVIFKIDAMILCLSFGYTASTGTPILYP